MLSKALENLLARELAKSFKFYKGGLVQAAFIGSSLHGVLAANNKLYNLSRVVKVHIINQEYLIETRNSFYTFAPTLTEDAAYFRRELEQVGVNLVINI